MNIGDVVKSNKGRDNGTIYVVYSLRDDYVFCVNGKNRTMIKPKKKKIRHVNYLGQNIDELKVKFTEHKKVLDSEIRKAIDNLNIVEE